MQVLTEIFFDVLAASKYDHIKLAFMPISM